MIDITNHHCPAMPQDPIIERENGTWLLILQDGYDEEEDTYETQYTEITHCPWCGKAL